MSILVTQSSMPTIDEYIKEIQDIWESKWLTNMGCKHQKLQAELKEYLDIQNIFEHQFYLAHFLQRQLNLDMCTINHPLLFPIRQA